MYLIMIMLPLIASVISGLLGRKIGVTGAHLVTSLSVITTTMISFILFLEVGLNNTPVSVNLARWIDSESLDVQWCFTFDSLTVSMLIPVLIVSSLVHVYSMEYMSHDPHNQRFFSYLSLFTFMMIILVSSNNYLLMFIGWEGVGVCSYLLVNFWLTRIAANQSALSAFLTNRMGDWFLTISMFGIILVFGSLDYAVVYSSAPYISTSVILVIGVCLLIGAMAKSSQIGLHVWLPMAMEGPTPVSALIHAATMVTAGVYLLMRSSPLIEYSSIVLLLCLWVGAITAIFSSLVGVFQQDIKKVIAYSTMSQLGMMVIAIGLSSYNVALFHLINHAFYKALLFLGAGSVIHAVSDNQDFRKYGGLKSFLPLTYSVMLIASLSLIAFPFMTGFYSKDFIIELSYGTFSFSSTVVCYISIIAAMFTTLYSFKVLYSTFLTNPNGPIINYKYAHEGNICMSLPLVILAVFSIVAGYISRDLFIGVGSDFFSDNSIYIHSVNEVVLNTEFAVPTILKIIPLISSILIVLISFIVYEFKLIGLIYFKSSRFGYNLYGLFNQRFLIEMYNNKFISGTILKLGGHTTKVLDKGSVELVGPYGLERGLVSLSRALNKISESTVTTYALYILTGLLLYISLPYINYKDLASYICISILIMYPSFEVINDVSNLISDKKITYKDYTLFHVNTTFDNSTIIAVNTSNKSTAIVTYSPDRCTAMIPYIGNKCTAIVPYTSIKNNVIAAINPIIGNIINNIKTFKPYTLTIPSGIFVWYFPSIFEPRHLILRFIDDNLPFELLSTYIINTLNYYYDLAELETYVSSIGTLQTGIRDCYYVYVSIDNDQLAIIYLDYYFNRSHLDSIISNIVINHYGFNLPEYTTLRVAVYYIPNMIMLEKTGFAVCVEHGIYNN